MSHDRVQYGWRALIGLVYIASSWVMEADFINLAPPGVLTHTTQVSLGGAVTVENLSKVGDQAVEGARRLAEAPVDSVILGCTSGSFIKGLGYDQEIIRRMREAAGRDVPTTTTATAVVEALRTLGARKVSVATPYPDAVNQRAIAFLEANGFKVTNLVGLGINDDPTINRQPLEKVYALTKQADTSDADVAFISCTAFRSVDIIDALEKDLGKPVISSNQASFWHALRLAGVRERIGGYGRLLNEF